MAPRPSNVNLLSQQLAGFPNLDPRAVIAIAGHEGLGGGIGDQGTSFGPFQLHYGGAYPSSAPHGQSASQAWAWSPQGIRYALSRIAAVAGGLHGRPAVEAISRRFERPANPDAEIADALAHYGGPLPASRIPAGAAPRQGSAPRPSAPSPRGGSSGRSAGPQMVPDTLLSSLIASTNQNLGLGSNPLLAGLLASALPRVRG